MKYEYQEKGSWFNVILSGGINFYFMADPDEVQNALLNKGLIQAYNVLGISSTGGFSHVASTSNLLEPIMLSVESFALFAPVNEEFSSVLTSSLKQKFSTVKVATETDAKVVASDIKNIEKRFKLVTP